MPNIKNYSLSFLLFLFTALIFFSCFVQAENKDSKVESYKIDKIELGGLNSIEEESLWQHIDIERGYVTPDDIDEVTRALYATGFFDQIKVFFKPVYKEKTRVLSFELREKKTVRKVFVEGNEEVSQDDLKEILKFKGNRFFDKKILLDLKEQALMLYQSKGFYEAEIDTYVKGVNKTEVDITFTIKEGERYRIAEISVNGLVDLSESKALSSMQTQEYVWWKSWLTGSGRLNKAMLAQDQKLLRQFLIDNGYVEASVADPEIQRRDSKLYISFDVKQGSKYEFGDVSVDGDLINKSKVETLEDIGISNGDTFSGEKLRRASFKISEKFSDIGYAFVNVVPKTAIDRKSRSVAVRFSVKKGEVVSVNKINIEGNQKTYDHVIRREILVDEGQTFSGKKVRRSEALLRRLGFFDEATIVSTPVKDKPDKVDLDVNVKEGATGSFSAGAGVSSSDGLVFNVRLSERNFLGTGRSLNANVNIGTIRDNIVFSLNDRRLFNSFWATGLDIRRNQLIFDDFERRVTGAGITGGYPLEQIFGEDFNDIRFSLKYEYMKVDITDVEEEAADFIKESTGKTTASSFTPRFTRNTIDNPLNPTSGSKQIIATEIAGVGGDEEYIIFDFKNHVYTPLFDTKKGPVVFSWRFQFSYGENLNDGRLPLFKRFFAGGINSVRGFRVRELGPKDENGSEFGGSKQIVNNLELIFPLVTSAGIRGVLFFDIGDALDDDEDIEFSELRMAYGAGIRWMSPMGPLRIEFGSPLDREDNESNFVTLFSFGTPL